MPIDLTQPLEVNKSRDYPNLSNPRIEGDLIIVQHSARDRDILQFHAATGVYVGHEASDQPLRLRNKAAEVAHKIFQIWFGHSDWAKGDWRYLQDDAMYQFDNGKDANAKAKALNAESVEAAAPWKFMVKSHTVMSPDHKWREWMQARFESGEYTAMPWKDEPWYNQDHFAHAAMSDPFKVAFVESAVKGAEDSMTVLNPGRYLERFYSEHLNAQEIAAWAAKADSEAELCFATTPDEIEDVYVNGGIDSCMKYAGDSSSFPLGVQPTRIYGAGDLALAYLKRRGKIVGRALVWPDRKVVGRIYGDKERLQNRLTAEGYTFVDGDRTVFEGARMLRIEIEGEIVLPYLDWSMGADDSDDGQHLIIRSNSNGRAKYRGQTQNGTASGRAIHICGHEGCRTRMNEDAGFYNAYTGRNMCGPCADTILARCCISGSNYPMTDRIGQQIMLQIMSRDGVTPFPGFRGGYVHTDNISNGSANGMYRRINNVVYPATETRIRPGTARTYEPIPADA
jgi:hypothetical protein